MLGVKAVIALLKNKVGFPRRKVDEKKLEDWMNALTRFLLNIEALWEKNRTLDTTNGYAKKASTIAPIEPQEVYLSSGFLNDRALRKFGRTDRRTSDRMNELRMVEIDSVKTGYSRTLEGFIQGEWSTGSLI